MTNPRQRSGFASLVLSFILSACRFTDHAAYEKAEFRAGSSLLPYRILKPLNIAQGIRYPLILFFHGSGERGLDNQRQLRIGGTLFSGKNTRERYPAYVVFPQCDLDHMWVEADWSDKNPHSLPEQPSAPIAMTRQLVDDLLKRYPIDENRIYVMGLSMGGFASFDFAARYPNLVAAGVAICGGADNRTAARMKDIPFWIFHGALDDVVWPERSRSMARALEEAGGTVRYTEYESVGHNSWNRALGEPELFPWLFAKKRGIAPLKQSAIGPDPSPES